MTTTTHDSQTTLVTGATGGIGSAIVAELLDQGHQVLAVDRDAQALDALTHPAVRTVAIDLCAPDAVGVILAAAQDGGPITRAALCAGVNEQTPLDDLSADAWRRLLEINLIAPLVLTRSLCLALRASGQTGSIVLLGSGAADTGHNGHTHYAASKAGLVAAVKSLAAELGPDSIRLNIVAPGPTRTPMTDALITDEIRTQLAAITPLGRMGEAADIAPAVAFLLSDKAAFVTGQTLHVNGGFYMA